MTNNDQRRGKHERAPAADATEELELLLREIEKEPAPERLLDLARQLQEALRRRDSGGQVG